MARTGTGRDERNAQLKAILAGLVGDSAGPEQTEEAIALFTEIHGSDQDEKDKLKEKDQALILLIRQFGAQLRQGKDWMLPGLYKLFNALGPILVGIEEILWELKKLPGNPPWREPGGGDQSPPGPGGGGKPSPGGGPKPTPGGGTEPRPPRP